MGAMVRQGMLGLPKLFMLGELDETGDGRLATGVQRRIKLDNKEGC